MELTWTPLSLVGFTAAAIDLALAAFVLATRPEASLNRRLASVLFLSSLTGAAFTARLLLPAPTDAYAMVVVFMVSVTCFVMALTTFVATIPSPLAAPLRTRPAPFVAFALGAAVVVAILTRTDLFIRGMRPFAHVPGWEFQNGAAWNAWTLSLALFSLYGLVVAVDAWRRAPGGIAGRRAGTFALGFGASNLIQAASTIYLVSVGDLDEAFPTYVNFVATPIGTMLFSAMVAYGILRFQLFDIDVRIKRGIRGGALAGLFVAVFFAATEIAQVLFAERVGAYVGIVATAGLAFALHPLQRLAERMADAAMPNVQATPQYLAYRRLEIYRAAYEGLVADGALTPKERATLDRLRASLDIAAPDAAALEAELARGAAPMRPEVPM